MRPCAVISIYILQKTHLLYVKKQKVLGNNFIFLHINYNFTHFLNSKLPKDGTMELIATKGFVIYAQFGKH